MSRTPPDESNFYVYQLRVEDEPLPFYVGKGKSLRAWNHERDAKNPNRQDLKSFKENKIRKALRECKSILVEILFEQLEEQIAHATEKTFISLYGRRDTKTGCLTNETDGGEGLSGHKHSQATKDKIRKSHTGMKAGENVLKALDRSNRPHSEATRNKISKSGIGRKHTLETLKKISEGNKGKIISEEHKRKQKEACSREFKILNPDGQLIIGKNLSQFSKEMGLNRLCLGRVINGTQEHHKGWRKSKLI